MVWQNNTTMGRVGGEVWVWISRLGNDIVHGRLARASPVQLAAQDGIISSILHSHYALATLLAHF